MRLDEVEAAFERIPRLHGAPLRICFRPLDKVEGGADIPRRFIILDSQLGRRGLRRVLIHEVFHFVWTRLGNPLRWSWEEILRRETRDKARGELGYSAELRRVALHQTEIARRGRRWREYACESFCDTAAFLYGGDSNADRLLAARFRARRIEWFRNQLEPRRIGL